MCAVQYWVQVHTPGGEVLVFLLFHSQEQIAHQETQGLPLLAFVLTTDSWQVSI